MAGMCRNLPNDPVILMTAYENLPSLVGKYFQT
jgi:hypothetical protein